MVAKRRLLQPPSLDAARLAMATAAVVMATFGQVLAQHRAEMSSMVGVPQRQFQKTLEDMARGVKSDQQRRRKGESLHGIREPVLWKDEGLICVGVEGQSSWHKAVGNRGADG